MLTVIRYSDLRKKLVLNFLCFFFLVTKLCPPLLWSHGLLPARLLCTWDFPGKNTEVGCYFLLQGSSLPRDWTWVCCIGKWILYHWAIREALKFLRVSINSINLSKTWRFENCHSHFSFPLESNAIVTPRTRARSKGFSNSPVPFIHLPPGF